jgi:hypothetical protein
MFIVQIARGGEFIRDLVEDRLRKGESLEEIFLSLFDKYERKSVDSSLGKLEYDLFKESLTPDDPLNERFNEYLHQWSQINA